MMKKIPHNRIKMINKTLQLKVFTSKKDRIREERQVEQEREL